MNSTLWNYFFRFKPQLQTHYDTDLELSQLFQALTLSLTRGNYVTTVTFDLRSHVSSTPCILRYRVHTRLCMRMPYIRQTWNEYDR